jgi:DeoR family transcriptional regulator of aga operon
MARQDIDAVDKPSLVPEERRRRIAERVRETGSVTVAMLEAEFKVSPMTARRDLAILEQEGRVRRTHGGAVLPGFAGHEDSFQQRVEEAVEAKRRLSRAAVALLEPGETVFIDSSTTAYHAATRLLTEGVRTTILTNSLPVMQLFSGKETPQVDLVGLGGSLRKLTLSYVGPQAVRAAHAHFADKTFLSVKGLTPDGYLTDPDPLEAEIKRAMIERAEEPVLLVDGRKFEQRGLNVIAHVSELQLVLAADAPAARLEALAATGVRVERV